LGEGVPALPLTISFNGDASLGAVLDAFQSHGQHMLVIDYAGQRIQPGYHVTEVKAGAFVTLDCGGNPDAWRETILQVEDLPASAQAPDHMAVSKFLTILQKVAERVDLDAGARLTFEVGLPEHPMQVFDVESLSIQADRGVLRLGTLSAICKPRHRMQQATAAAGPSCKPGSGCCSPQTFRAAGRCHGTGPLLFVSGHRPGAVIPGRCWRRS